MTLPDDDRALTPSPSPSPSPDRQPPKSAINPSESSEPDRDFDHEFLAEFEAVAESLAALDARYRQIQRDRHQRDQIQAEMQAIAHSNARSPRSKANPPSSDRDRLRRVRDRLEQLELNLESSLFSWSGLREPVWFGLRYGGLGFILGWLLHACTQ